MSGTFKQFACGPATKARDAASSCKRVATGLRRAGGAAHPHLGHGASCGGSPNTWADSMSGAGKPLPGPGAAGPAPPKSALLAHRQAGRPARAAGLGATLPPPAASCAVGHPRLRRGTAPAHCAHARAAGAGRTPAASALRPHSTQAWLSEPTPQAPPCVAPQAARSNRPSPRLASVLGHRPATAPLRALRPGTRPRRPCGWRAPGTSARSTGACSSSHCHRAAVPLQARQSSTSLGLPRRCGCGWGRRGRAPSRPASGLAQRCRAARRAASAAPGPAGCQAPSQAATSARPAGCAATAASLSVLNA